MNGYIKGLSVMLFSNNGAAFFNTAYRDFEERVTLAEGKTSAIDLVRNAVNNTIGKFTKSNIMELVPSVGKTSVENSLKTLIGEGVIGRAGKGKATFYFRKN